MPQSLATEPFEIHTRLHCEFVSSRLGKRRVAHCAAGTKARTGVKLFVGLIRKAVIVMSALF